MDIPSLAERGGNAIFLLLVVGSAAFYTIAMVAMKSWSGSSAPVLIFVITIAITLAALLEIMALRGERLAMVYVAILAAEVVMIALVSAFLYQESFSMREIAGCGLVITGAALAWSA